jgi:hypothetical protein
MIEDFESESLVAAKVAERVGVVVANIEQAMAQMRKQAHDDALREAAEIEAEARASAERLRRETAAELADYVADSRRAIENYTNERVARISALTGRLIEQGELLQERFEATAVARRQLYDLISTIGDTAEKLAHEANTTAPELPPFPDPPQSERPAQR